jgi:hypothetical protein
MTTEISEPGQVPPAAAVPRKNSFERIAGVLFAPAETFEDISRKPDFLVPILLILLIGYASTILLMPRMDWDSVMAQQAEQMKKRQPNMTEADMERASGIVKTFGTVMAYIAPILMFAWYVVVAGIFLLAFRLMGGQGTFGQAFSTVLYSWIPMLVNSIVITIVAIMRGSVDPVTMATLVKSNPAFLVDMKAHPALYSLLASVDIFTIWMLILLIIGFATLSRVSRAKAAAIVISLWLVLVLVKSAFALIGAGMQA